MMTIRHAALPLLWGLLAVSLTLPGNAQVFAGSGHNLMLNNITTDGELAAGHNLMCTGCRIGGGVAAGHNVQLQSCPQVSRVSAGANVQLIGTNIQHGVSAGHSIYIENGSINGNLSAGHAIELLNTDVQGDVAAGNLLKLQHASVDNIRVSGSGASSININNGVMLSRVGGNYTSSVQIANGHSNVTIGGNSVSSINGFVVKSGNGQTTVITPEQIVYVNSRKVSGDGPAQYAEYQRQHPNAPNINASGWNTSNNNQETVTFDNEFSPKIELLENSTVRGSIAFDGTPGIVLLHHGSTLQGKVTNGKIQSLP